MSTLINARKPALSLFLVILFLKTGSVRGDIFDCFWGGSNESTTYTAPYYPGMGGVTLNQVARPDVNLGAPAPAIPVQATANTMATTIPQSTIPTITVPSGPIGAPGRPATSETTASGMLPQLPPGTELVYVMPPTQTEKEQCINGVPGVPAVASKVVPPGTPGAIPVAVRTVTVTRPKVEYQWSYSPIRNKTNTLVKEVDPRTGRVVRSYCKDNEDRSLLPWPHRKEVITYETVTAKVGTPVNLPAGTLGATGTVIRGSNAPTMTTPVRHETLYPTWNPDPYSAQPIEGSNQRTVIIP